MSIHLTKKITVGYLLANMNKKQLKNDDKTSIKTCPVILNSIFHYCIFYKLQPILIFVFLLYQFYQLNIESQLFYKK